MLAAEITYHFILRSRQRHLSLISHSLRWRTNGVLCIAANTKRSFLAAYVQQKCHKLLLPVSVRFFLFSRTHLSAAHHACEVAAITTICALCENPAKSLIILYFLVYISNELIYNNHLPSAIMHMLIYIYETSVKSLLTYTRLWFICYNLSVSQISSNSLTRIRTRRKHPTSSQRQRHNCISPNSVCQLMP